MERQIKMLASHNGGYWGNHPDHPTHDWRQEVANNETRLGYWEWVEGKLNDRAKEGDAQAAEELNDAKEAAK